MKIVNRSGSVIVNYTYDALGKILSVKDAAGNEITDMNNLALLNPLRYRGYVYDDETGLYYLQSRYYDPTVGRFLNADTIFDTASGTPLSTNMFAYCENNPISKVDQSGYLGLYYPNPLRYYILALGTYYVYHTLSLTLSMYYYAYTGAKHKNVLGFSDTERLFGMMKTKLMGAPKIRNDIKRLIKRINNRNTSAYDWCNYRFKSNSLRELDLSLSLGSVYYFIKVTRICKQWNGYWKYLVYIKTQDWYDFHDLSDSDRNALIIFINQIGGYNPQKKGSLRSYYWQYYCSFYCYYK